MKCIYWSIGAECYECGGHVEMHEDAGCDLNLRTVFELLRQEQLLDDTDESPRCPECGAIVGVWWTGIEDFADMGPF